MVPLTQSFFAQLFRLVALEYASSCFTAILLRLAPPGSVVLTPWTLVDVRLNPAEVRDIASHILHTNTTLNKTTWNPNIFTAAGPHAADQEEILYLPSDPSHHANDYLKTANTPARHTLYPTYPNNEAGLPLFAYCTGTAAPKLTIDLGHVTPRRPLCPPTRYSRAWTRHTEWQ